MLAEHGDKHVLMVANPHWGGPRGNVKEIHVSFSTEQGETAAEWMAGRYDALQTSLTTPAESPDTFSQIVPGSARPSSVSAPTSRPSRTSSCKAFSHAVDRDELKRGSTRSHSPRPRAARSRPPCQGIAQGGPDFDLELARQCLADAGYADGKGLPKLTILLAALAHGSRAARAAVGGARSHRRDLGDAR